MALWKETAQNEPRTMPNEQRMAAQSEPSEKVEAVPAPVPPVAPRRESMPRDRHESVLGLGVSIEGKMEGDGDVRRNRCRKRAGHAFRVCSGSWRSQGKNADRLRRFAHAGQRRVWLERFRSCEVC
jgi:hypothetical protein